MLPIHIIALWNIFDTEFGSAGLAELRLRTGIGAQGDGSRDDQRTSTRPVATTRDEGCVTLQRGM